MFTAISVIQLARYLLTLSSACWALGIRSGSQIEERHKICLKLGNQNKRKAFKGYKIRKSSAYLENVLYLVYSEQFTNNF